MIVVGLTGGVGSGKSTAAELFAHHGADVIDADEVAREVVAPGTPGLQRVIDRFGPEFLQPDGSLDRSALATRVFGDAEGLADLNGIIHPMVREVITERLEAMGPQAEVVILMVPLLIESGQYPVDALMVVDCEEDVAVHRVVEQRGWTEDDARRRIAAQATREERRNAADFVIDNSDGFDELQRQVDEAWTWIERLHPAI